jgi:hypothetical protein
VNCPKSTQVGTATAKLAGQNGKPDNFNVKMGAPCSKHKTRKAKRVSQQGATRASRQ